MKPYVPRAERVIGCLCNREKLFTLAGYKLHLQRCPINTQRDVTAMRAERGQR